MHPSVLARAEKAVEKEFVFPEDVLGRIKENSAAWEHYQSFSPAYQRIRIAYIEGARERPEEFEKRLANFIKKTEAGKQFGFGGIDKYY